MKRLGLGAILAAVGVLGLFAVTILHALTAGHNRLRAGEFIAVLASATVLVIVGAAYEWSHERARLRVTEDRAKHREQAEADEGRRLHEARLAGVK
jgi:hypothetical protein